MALTVAWDQAAIGYDTYFVPRFEPWLRDACARLAVPLPPGGLVIPCCGTGPELVSLHQLHPEREILGVDLSSGMLQLAYQRTRHLPLIRTQTGDATDTDGWPPCAGVLSLFGLQQMQDPPLALRRWVEALVPGGLLSVMFWPSEVEDEGPFSWFRQAIARRLSLPVPTWEAALPEQIEAAGAELLLDAAVAHPMEHESALSFFEAMLTSGPGRSLVLAHGDAWIDELRSDFVAHAPAGPLAHRPRARHLVARRGALYFRINGPFGRCISVAVVDVAVAGAAVVVLGA
ncbi:MAG: class I SAM-dependent methyltransferase [Polyangiaceae bacterium]|jgi:SAM-dependent methyltransferase|nr:class I SAM-dependent methyltransferase [Polyangiaceae bacterium]